MPSKIAKSNPNKSINEQRRAQMRFDAAHRRKKDSTEYLMKLVKKITDEVVREQLRLKGVNPFPTCPNCGTQFHGPTKLYEDMPCQTTLAISDDIVNGLPPDM